MKNFQQKLETHILCAKLPPEIEISFKSVFGARAAYADNQIFSTFGKFGFALKLPDDVCSQLFSEGLAVPLKYFDKGHVKRNYAVLQVDDPTMNSRLRRLIADSVEFVKAKR